MTPTRPPSHHPRRVWGLAAGLGVLAALGLAAPAAAINEFPPNPAATAASTCDPAPGFSYTLTNIGGLDSATFTVEVTTEAGTTSTTEQVAVNASTTLHADVPEDTTGTLTITSDGMAPVTLTEAIDCFEGPSAVIEPTCGLNGAAISFTLEDPDDQAQAWVITVDGHTYDFDDDVFFQYGGDLAEGDTWEAVVTADGEQVASLSGTVDCVQPAAEIELVCTGAGPDLLIHLHDDDATATDYEVTWPEVSREDGAIDAGSGTSTVTVDPGTGVRTLSWPLPREVGYDVSVATAADGVLADLAGSSGCAEVGVLPGDPVVNTPVVPVTGTWTPAPVSAGGVQTTELARTGTETPYLVALGTGLLGLGIVIVRLGRRMLARP